MRLCTVLIPILQMRRSERKEVKELLGLNMGRMELRLEPRLWNYKLLF